MIFSCSNNPHRNEDIIGNNILSAYGTPLKYVDSVKSYYSYEAVIIDQVYECLFQYHYLKRPYELIPSLAEEVPVPRVKNVTIKEPYSPRRFDKNNNEILKPRTINAISYTIKIKKNIYYAPHPAFPYNKEKNTNTRELKAGDFLYAFKRMADQKLACWIFPVFVSRVVGMDRFNKYNQEKEITVKKGDTLESITLKYYKDKKYLDLFCSLNNNIKDKDLVPGKTKLKIIRFTDYSYPISGIIIHNDHTFEILLKKEYPQILYWMAMHFTSPIPEEVVAFYKEKELKGVSIEEKLAEPFYLPYPIGTGPYMMVKWKKREEIILAKNPLFREEYYPNDGIPEDKEKGLLEDAGKRLPFIDKYIFKYSPAYIPRWNNFMLGYQDVSGVGKEHFNNVITDQKTLSSDMGKKGIRLEKEVVPVIFYYGFNMLDKTVGGYTEKKQFLRQAIARALNVGKYKKIFLSGRGLIPNSPIPPGIFGYEKKVESYNNFNLEKAKRLLVKAGYKDGIDPKAGKPLEIT